MLVPCRTVRCMQVLLLFTALYPSLCIKMAYTQLRMKTALNITHNNNCDMFYIWRAGCTTTPSFRFTRSARAPTQQAAEPTKPLPTIHLYNSSGAPNRKCLHLCVDFRNNCEPEPNVAQIRNEYWEACPQCNKLASSHVTERYHLLA
jgi:hypothetical protein